MRSPQAAVETATAGRQARKAAIVKPPSTGRVCPVMKARSGRVEEDDRGGNLRRRAVAALRTIDSQVSRACGECISCAIGVAIGPGAVALTRILMRRDRRP